MDAALPMDALPIEAALPLYASLPDLASAPALRAALAPTTAEGKQDTELNTLTEVRSSGLPGAGLGLFARADLKRNAVLGVYGGELLSAAAVAARYPAGEAQYVLDIGGGRFRDAADPARSNVLRFINATRNSGRRPNVRFCWGRGTVRTKRRVRAGEELLAVYGTSFSMKRA